jgi:hypothetical protein
MKTLYLWQPFNWTSDISCLATTLHFCVFLWMK